MAAVHWSALIGHPALQRSSRTWNDAPALGRSRSSRGREAHPVAAVSGGPGLSTLRGVPGCLTRRLRSRAGCGCRRVGKRSVDLLVDTGAALLSPAILRVIGIDPAQARAHQQIMTASGYIVVPVVTIPRLQCLGQQRDHYQALAHALPFGSAINGV